MPMFDIKCINCNHIQKDVFLKKWNDSLPICRCCGSLTRKIPTAFKPDVFPEDGVFLEHVSAEGKRFFSKKEMLNYEKETGAYIDMAH